MAPRSRFHPTGRRTVMTTPWFTSAGAGRDSSRQRRQAEPGRLLDGTAGGRGIRLQTRPHSSHAPGMTGFVVETSPLSHHEPPCRSHIDHTSRVAGCDPVGRRSRRTDVAPRLQRPRLASVVGGVLREALGSPRHGASHRGCEARRRNRPAAGPASRTARRPADCPTETRSPGRHLCRRPR